MSNSIFESLHIKNKFREAGNIVQQMNASDLVVSADHVINKLRLFFRDLKEIYPDISTSLEDNSLEVLEKTKDKKLKSTFSYVMAEINAENIDFSNPELAQPDSDNFFELMKKHNIGIVDFNTRNIPNKKNDFPDVTNRYLLAIPLQNGMSHIVGLNIKNAAPHLSWSEAKEKDLERKYRTSQALISPASRMVHKLCDDIKINFNDNNSVLVADVKTRERMRQKAITEYEGDISKISDGTRFMILFDEAEQISDIRKSLASSKSHFAQYLDKKGYEVYQYKDMFDTPKKHGYVGFLLKCRPKDAVDNSDAFEIQIMQRELHNHYNKRTHELYESYRPQIEYYNSHKIPLAQWDDETKNALLLIRDIHKEGAEATGVMDYITNWPTDEADGVERYEEDIPPDHYMTQHLYNAHIFAYNDHQRRNLDTSEPS